MRMKWPWAKPEIRSSYSDLVLSGQIARAEGHGSSANLTSALEIASGLWSRSLSLATVEPSSPALAGLTPTVLSDIGTQLCRYGEAIYTIVVENGEVVLYPVSDHTVTGSYDQKSWAYRVTQAGPTSTSTRTIAPDQILHVRLSCDPSEPWKGRSPLSRCPETAALSGNLETMLRREAGGPQGSFLAVPEASDPDSDPLGDLRTGIAGAKGAPILHETVATGYGDKGNAPHGDLRQTRFGAAWPAPVSDLRDPVSMSVMSACGIPVSLIANSDGTAAREAFRRFLVTTIKPVAKILETEVRTKLDPDASLSFGELAASDVSGKSRAVGQLVKSGVSLGDALALVGLEP